MGFAASLLACLFAACVTLILIHQVVSLLGDSSDSEFMAGVGCFAAPFVPIACLLFISCTQISILSHFTFAIILLNLAIYANGESDDPDPEFVLMPIVLCIAWYSITEHGGNPFEGVITTITNNPFRSALVVCCAVVCLPSMEEANPPLFESERCAVDCGM